MLKHFYDYISMGSFITIQLYFSWRIKSNYVLLYTNIYINKITAML